MQQERRENAMCEFTENASETECCFEKHSEIVPFTVFAYRPHGDTPRS